MTSPTVEETLAFAKRAHAGQNDKGDMPYWHHLEAVMRLLPLDATDDWRRAALLHDVLEDTNYTADDLRAMGYSEDVIRAVQIVTRPIDDTDYLKWIETIRGSNNVIAKAIKVADLTHNLDPGRFFVMDETKRNAMRERYRRALILLQS